MGIEMMYLVNEWLRGSPSPPQTDLPAGFMRRVFAVNGYGVYTKDDAKTGTAAFEIVSDTLKRLNINLDPARGEPTNDRTLFSRVYAPPERSFGTNREGGAVIFTELSSPKHPAHMTPCIILTQASRPADHLLEAHEYTPVFCMTGRYTYDNDNSFVMVVETLHQQMQSISPTDINTKLAMCYADTCFSQFLSEQRMDPAAALKAADALSLNQIEDRLATMSARPIGFESDFPIVKAPALNKLEAK